MGKIKKFLAGALLGLSSLLPSQAQPAETFIRGDANHDQQVSITDPIITLQYLFKGGSPPKCPDAADTNNDGKINVADAVYILDYLFRRGHPPVRPFPERGYDLIKDELGCNGKSDLEKIIYANEFPLVITGGGQSDDPWHFIINNDFSTNDNEAAILIARANNVVLEGNMSKITAPIGIDARYSSNILVRYLRFANPQRKGYALKLHKVEDSKFEYINTDINTKTEGGAFLSSCKNLELRDSVFRVGSLGGIQMEKCTDCKAENITLLGNKSPYLASFIGTRYTTFKNAKLLLDNETQNGITLEGVANWITFNDSTIEGNPLLNHIYFFPESMGGLTLLNVEFPNYDKKISFDSDYPRLYVRWYLDIFAKDTQGVPLPRVSIRTFNRYKAPTESLSTNIEGKARTDILQYHQGSRTTEFYTPYTLQIAKEGYKTQTLYTDLNENTSLEVVLESMR